MAKPARSIHKIGRKRVIGSFMSAKMAVPVEWESQIERDFFYYLEFDDDVHAYAAQPIRYRYTLDHKYHYHYPDVEIFRYSTNQQKFVEIKPFHVTQKLDFQEKTAAIHAQMVTDGHDYSVVTDAQIRVEPTLNNLKLLYRYILHEYDPQNLKMFIHHLKETGVTALTFEELKDKAEESSFALIDCYSFIANKIFSFNIQEPLSPATVLTLSIKAAE